MRRASYFLPRLLEYPLPTSPKLSCRLKITAGSRAALTPGRRGRSSNQHMPTHTRWDYSPSSSKKRRTYSNQTERGQDPRSSGSAPGLSAVTTIAVSVSRYVAQPRNRSCSGSSSSLKSAKIPTGWISWGGCPQPQCRPRASELSSRCTGAPRRVLQGHFQGCGLPSPPSVHTGLPGPDLSKDGIQSATLERSVNHGNQRIDRPHLMYPQRIPR